MRRRTFIAGLGSAAVWPVGARAQRSTVPVVGYLSSDADGANRPRDAAFRLGLAEQGYIEGRNLEILWRWAETQYDRLPGLAADLVRNQVALIVASSSTNTTLAAKSSTSTIPIVFLIGADPVDVGLVASFNRPGANITGVTALAAEVTAKRLQLMRELAPTSASIGLLCNPTNVTTKR